LQPYAPRGVETTKCYVSWEANKLYVKERFPYYRGKVYIDFGLSEANELSVIATDVRITEFRGQ